MTRRLLAFALLATSAFAVNLPRPAGDIVIKLPFGQVSLSQYKGKVIVFAFILTG